MKRILNKSANKWQLYGEIETPTVLLGCNELQIAQSEMDRLPPRFDVMLEGASGKQRNLATAYKTSTGGESKIKLSNTSGEVRLGGNDLAEGYNILFLDKDKILYQHDLIGGEALEVGLPWIFVQSNDYWRFDGQASHKCKEDLALVLINNKVIKIEDSNGIADKIDEIENLGSLYEICGETTFFTQDGEIYLIQTNIIKSLQESYVVEGKIVPYPSNIPIFNNTPQIYRIDQEFLRKLPATGKVEIRYIGHSQQWQPLGNKHIGVMNLRLVGRQQETLFRKRIAILPHDFQISFTGDERNPLQGKINLLGSMDFEVYFDTQEIRGKISSIGNGHEIALEALTSIPPETVVISLRKAENSGEIKLKLPFPAQGVRVFDGKGEAISQDTTLFLEELYGVRAYIFKGQSNQPEKYQLRFSLGYETGIDTGDVYYEVRGIVESAYQEIALINYKEKIQTLLSASNNLDASICLDITTSNGAGASLTIRQYSSSLEKDHCLGGVILNNSNFCKDDLENTDILASPLFKPDQEPEALYSVLSKATDRREWIFDDKTHDAGPWLLFPSAKSHIKFRPLLWTIKDDFDIGKRNNPSISILEEAVSIRDQETRQQCLNYIIDLMSFNFNHTGWNYLHLIWKHMGHLPLATFDIWRAFTRNNRALIVLLCLQETRLLDRMQFELPVLWELIALEDWISVFQSYLEYAMQKYGELADEIVHRKISYIEHQLRLQGVGTVLKAEIFHEEDPVLAFLSSDSSDFLKSDINREYQGDEGYCGLLHRHLEDRWPEILKSEIEHAFAELPESICALIPNEQQDYRKSITYLPILLAYKTVKHDTYPLDNNQIRIFKMKMLRSFDEEWFYYLFNITQGYVWLKRITPEKELKLCKTATTVH